MKQRLRDDKKHGVSGATLSAGMCGQGISTKMLKKVAADSRSCGLWDSVWASDQLSSV